MYENVDWQKCNGLIPAIIQNVETLEVLMLGFMNKEALELTYNTNKVHFWSRAKNRIWMKGEASGNILNVVSINLDCDNDSFLILVNPIGNTCHNGTKSCFKIKTNFLSELEEIINDRIKNPQKNSYISKLYAKGINKISQKVGEEATEVIIAALNEQEKLAEETADLLFHLLILLNKCEFSIIEIIDILRNRNNNSS